MRMGLPKVRLFQLMILGRFLFHGILCTSSVAAASTYNFIANQRPRFQIPHGNLSYYRSPQWEVLYYLKFGTFPFYSSSSPFFNRTQYLNKIRMIKSLIDRKNGQDVQVDYDSPSDSETDPVTDLSQSSIDQLRLIPTVNSLEENSKLYHNDYYPLIQSKKMNQLLSSIASPLPSPLSPETGMKLKRENMKNNDKDKENEITNSILIGTGSAGSFDKSQSEKTWKNNNSKDNNSKIKPKMTIIHTKWGDKGHKGKKNRKGVGFGFDDDDAIVNGLDPEVSGVEKPDIDYFLVDGDPSWVRGRVIKQISPTSQMFPSGSVLGDGGMGGGPMAAEMTIERKVGRKFQTQGWKK